VQARDVAISSLTSHPIQKIATALPAHKINEQSLAMTVEIYCPYPYVCNYDANESQS
jgi:hypothetical protein